MRLSEQALIGMACLIFLIQALILYWQHKVNTMFRGIQWWIAGSLTIALGVLCMAPVREELLHGLVLVGHPLMLLGQMFIYVGVVRFVDKKENYQRLIVCYLLFLLAYGLRIQDRCCLSAGNFLYDTGMGLVMLLTAYRLQSGMAQKIGKSRHFMAGVFVVSAILLFILAIRGGVMPGPLDYPAQDGFLDLSLAVLIMASQLWSFGFAILIGQRLLVEVNLEKEKMQVVFRTIPDGILITRIPDGKIVDANPGFAAITGFSNEETVGKRTVELGLWANLGERQKFLDVIMDKGACENRETVFSRKGGKKFLGVISSKIIQLYGVPHIISSIHDITERKMREKKIQDLIKQLELEKESAQQISVTDSLTGLMNRRFFDEELKKEYYRLKRSGGSLSLIMLDIDFFKKYNDTYGHVAGDECLRILGRRFAELVVRQQDTIARYGGEEFVVILPETESEGALAMAEKIRQAVEEMQIPNEKAEISPYVTVSLGVITVYANWLEEPEQVVELADKALYEAKINGRNRVVEGHLTTFPI